jgi:uncharacterized protein (TIRG00374 family)
MGTNHPKRNPKKIIIEVFKYLGFLALTIYLLYISFKGMKWTDLRDGLLNADYWWVGGSMLTGYLAMIVRAQRWRIIIEPLGYKPSLRNTYDAVMLTYLSNFAVPRIGEIVRCGVLRKTEKIPFDSLLGTVVLERVFDMVCLLLIIVAVVCLRLDTFGVFMHDNIWHPLMEQNATSARLGVFVILGILFVAFILLIVCWKKLVRFSIFHKVDNLVKGLVNGLKAGFRLKKHGQFFGFTLLLWILYFFQSFTVMHAMPETSLLGSADALFLMVVGSLGWVVPVQGGLGAYHFLVSLALSVMYGIPQVKGVVFATISHETQALVMIVFGFISLASVFLFTKRKQRTGTI